MFGYNSDSDTTVCATTVLVTLHVRPSGFDGESSNVPPTPDLYAQLLAEMQKIVKMSDSAVQTAAAEGSFVLYPSGHRDRLDVAVRRAVLTGVGQTVRQLSLINAQDMGCDLMEITAHGGARPSHAAWQGKIVSLSGRKGYLSLKAIGYGTGDGFGGWNCRHDWFPFFEGISQRAYTEERLKELNEPHTVIGGRRYTDYEVSQMQRALERNIRKQKRQVAAANVLVTSAPDEAQRRAAQADFTRESVKLKAAEQELKNFCKQTGFLPDTSRVWVNGFGRSVSQRAVHANKKALTSGAKSCIIKSIDVDDYELVTYGKNIAQEVSNVIIETMRRCERNGKFVISEISTAIVPTTTRGTPVLQIEPTANGLLRLNVNAEYLSGKTLEEINIAFLNTDNTVVNSLEEAVIHESGHAISISGKSSHDVKKLYDELKDKGLPGVSEIALKDGAECLAELEVLRHRGTIVSTPLAEFYKKYMGRDY